MLCLICVVASGCFGSRSATERSYYVMHGVRAESTRVSPMLGLVRVRDMDTASIYEKFQIVVRKSPFELTYSEANVWAVKPNRMVADVIGRTLAESHLFESVTRELGELRPDFILGGTLNAIEIYDSDDLWFAHLALTLNVTRFNTGESIAQFQFDERKEIPTQKFSHGARALSELLSRALQQFFRQLEASLSPGAPPERIGSGPLLPDEPSPSPPASGVVFVPEKDPEKEPQGPEHQPPQ